MDRRREPRLEISRPVVITVLTDPPVTCAGVLLNISARGVQLRSELAAPLNAPVKVLLDDALLLGEVCYCRQEWASEDSGPNWLVGLANEQVLTNLDELKRLVMAVMGREQVAGRHEMIRCE
jgi:hypothetical protein